MATTSFNKDFVISDAKSIKVFQAQVENPKKIVITSRDLQAEKVKGIQLLKQQLSASVTC
jgi:hypothetical protein